MSGHYGMGGYAGPSENIPRDTGGVEVRAPAGLPVNRAPGRETGTVYASADDPAVRRRLPFIALVLLVAMMAVLFYFGNPGIALMLLLPAAAIGGLIFWLRSMD